MRSHNLQSLLSCLAPAGAGVIATLMLSSAHAASPGITGTAFSLQAHDGYINQPDGAQVYTWGYGCNTTVGDPNRATPAFKPVLLGSACPQMQIPAPTLIVTEGQVIKVTLTNNLPPVAGNTSLLFPGFKVAAAAATAQPSTCKSAATALVQGVLAKEVANGCAVTYTFTAGAPGTRAYYSGTQGDLQVEMGLYGAIIVLPKSPPAICANGIAKQNRTANSNWGEADFRLATAAYDHPKSCYDREYLFQFHEMDINIHRAAQTQVQAASLSGCAAATFGCTLQVPTEPYQPVYFMINGRSMPDDMDPNYASQYPNQPYNGNPHMHPGEQVLLRVIGQGRWQHPFHEHANHVRILARDGNLLLSQSNPNDLSGLLMFTTTTTPGQAFDGIFYYTGRGLNWDMYGHNPGDTSGDPLAHLACTPDAYGYNTGFSSADTAYSGTPSATAATAINYYEWCQDHNKPLEANPLGDMPGGGPATLPNANIVANGAWYSGSPYLGPDATLRSSTTLGNGTASSGCVTGTLGVGTGGSATATPNCSNLNPTNVQANPANERGFAFMWHSHNEREITTNNVFPGGMFMMMLVDSREFVIDETN